MRNNDMVRAFKKALVKAFTLVEESKHYKMLVEEAKKVLEKSVVKAA